MRSSGANGKVFKRTIEDFVCRSCGSEVRGNGYTDHCPYCLLSVHVDVNPGDRAEACKGDMVPISAELVSGDFKITYRCKRCGVVRRVVAAENDNRDILTALTANIE